MGLEFFGVDRAERASLFSGRKGKVFEHVSGDVFQQVIRGVGRPRKEAAAIGPVEPEAAMPAGQPAEPVSTVEVETPRRRGAKRQLAASAPPSAKSVEASAFVSGDRSLSEPVEPVRVSERKPSRFRRG